VASRGPALLARAAGSGPRPRGANETQELAAGGAGMGLDATAWNGSVPLGCGRRGAREVLQRSGEPRDLPWRNRAGWRGPSDQRNVRRLGNPLQKRCFLSRGRLPSNAMQISCGALWRPPRPTRLKLARGGRSVQGPASCICGLDGCMD